MSDDLTTGASGPEVDTLQQQLQAIGYQLPASGTYDDATADVVRQFQQYCGLPDTGIADEQTRSYLESYVASAAAGQSTDYTAAEYDHQYSEQPSYVDQIYAGEEQPAAYPAETAPPAAEQPSDGGAGQQTVSQDDWTQLIAASVQVHADSGEA
jgi:peptidoglycan hydrolase-like protein with peptidoglycan-binding domain